MFGTIRKHQTWLWAVIITLTIISFVIYFGPQSKLNSKGGGGAANYGSINGERITAEEFADTEREVSLRYFFMSGTFPSAESKNSGFDPMRETYYRLLLIHKEKDFGIHLSSESIAQTARNMLRPLQKANINSPAAFVKQILEPRGFQVDDFERFVRHEMGIQELVSTIALSGKLVTPQEARGLYEREHEEVATQAAFFSATNYLPTVTATPEAVSQFYTNHLPNYRIPERMQASYVEYVLTNFLADANTEMAKMTNIDERLEAVYQQRGTTNYYKEAKSPQEAKEKIREEMRKELMTMAAAKQANAFANEVFDKEPTRPENLAALAKQKNLAVKVSAPFDREEGPKDLHVNADFTKKAFGLTTNEPFAGPLVGEDAVYVIAMDKRIPSEIPPLEQIRERVTADYKYDQAKSSARQAGQTFYTTVTNGLAQGKTFSNICAEAKVQMTELPPFSLSTRAVPEAEEHLTLNGRGGLKELAFSTAPGKPSNFQPTLEGGAILYVKAKLPIDQAKLNAELPNFVDSVRQNRQSEAFNEWFRRQAERGLQDTPLGRPKPAPTISSKTAKS